MPPIPSYERSYVDKVAAENNRRLNITPLKTPRFRSLAPKVYDTEKHNPAKRGSNLMKEKFTYSKNTFNLIIANTGIHYMYIKYQ